jgi:hypothetical protein
MVPPGIPPLNLTGGTARSGGTFYTGANVTLGNYNKGLTPVMMIAAVAAVVVGIRVIK